MQYIKMHKAIGLVSAPWWVTLSVYPTRLAFAWLIIGTRDVIHNIRGTLLIALPSEKPRPQLICTGSFVMFGCVIFERSLKVTVRSMLQDRCLSCLPVCSVDVLWMSQDATWHGGRARSRRHCVRRGPSSSSRERGTAAPTFRPISIVAKLSPTSNC